MLLLIYRNVSMFIFCSIFKKVERNGTSLKYSNSYKSDVYFKVAEVESCLLMF
jgi:hypothetical protein